MCGLSKVLSHLRPSNKTLIRTPRCTSTKLATTHFGLIEEEYATPREFAKTQIVVIRLGSNLYKVNKPRTDSAFMYTQQSL